MIERKTTLYWVLDPTAFEAINSNALISTTRPLGTGVSSVNKMIACAEEMEFLLPNILGTSPKSGNTDWSKAVSDYWHNFGLEVPLEGIPFDISLNVDLFDPLRKEYMKNLLGEIAPNAKDNVSRVKAIEDYLKLDTTPEEEKFRYSIPNNIADYLAWRYCLVSSIVANEPNYIVKTTRIQFYLMDDAKAEERKAMAANIKNQAIRKYTDIISDKNESKLDNFLISSDSVSTLKELKKLTKVDKENILMDMATIKSAKFLELCADKQLETISEIKKLTMASLINNIPNSSIYVDATNPSMVLGNSLSEVISFMANAKNTAYINELRIKFNALTL